MIPPFFVLLACGLAQIAAAVPLAIRADTNTTNTTQSVTDTQVLQFALTLENLESAFYQKYISQFTDEDFANAGYEAWVRPRYMQIAEHEKTHVEFLTSALGNSSVAPCDYDFPVTDVSSFVAVSEMLEAVGTAAYAGSAQLLSETSVLTAAASILSTEASHAAWIQSAVRKEEPWSGSFGNYLDMDQAYSLASAFITSCPDSNPALPVQSFPKLTVVDEYTPGSTITLQYSVTSNSSQSANSSIVGRNAQGFDAAFNTPAELWQMLQEAASILSTLSTTSTASQTTTVSSSTATTTDATTTTSTTTSHTTSTASGTTESSTSSTPTTVTSTDTESITATSTAQPSPSESASAQMFLALIHGLNTTFIPLTLSSNGTEGVNETMQASGELPGDLQGTVFAVVTNDQSSVSDNTTIAGPVLLSFPFNSTVENSQ